MDGGDPEHLFTATPTSVGAGSPLKEVGRKVSGSVGRARWALRRSLVTRRALEEDDPGCDKG